MCCLRNSTTRCEIGQWLSGTTHKQDKTDKQTMLYSLCMKFQVELEIFKFNLKIVFCINIFISPKLGNGK